MGVPTAITSFKSGSVFGRRQQRRRLFVRIFGVSLAGHAALPRAQITAGGMRRVGLLAPSTRANEEITLRPFFEQMRQLGWIEGQNIR